jgi:flagellar hook protein FlgE
MSLFGSLYTAVSGLNAQATAFGNISDNVANSQTVGFKGINTSFQDYLTTSTSVSNQPGAVDTTPEYTNSVQGTVTANSNPLALAISGQGFFAVQEADGESTAGTPTFSPQQYYTRTGDWNLTKDGFLMNSAGEYLQGWQVNNVTTNGVTVATTDQSQLRTVQVNQGEYAPVATSVINLSANLPASQATAANTGTTTTTDASQITVYDTQGTAQTLTLTWTPVSGSADTWTGTLTDPNNPNTTANPSTLGTFTATFGSNGTLSSLSNASANGAQSLTASSSTTTGDAATVTLIPNTTDFYTSTGNATGITINLGTIGGSTGVTQFAGTTYNQQSVTQNGVSAGAFSGVAIDANGNVIVNYDNGQQTTAFQIPVVTFNSPDSLQRVNGQAFTSTQASGSANTQYANVNAAGALVTGSVEASNVDIATQLSQLIITQNAYGANSKVVTLANQLLQETIQMVQ